MKIEVRPTDIEESKDSKPPKSPGRSPSPLGKGNKSSLGRESKMEKSPSAKNESKKDS